MVDAVYQTDDRLVFVCIDINFKSGREKFYYEC